MPAKYKRGQPKSKPTKEEVTPPSQESCQEEQETAQEHIDSNDQSKLEISSAEAEIYFEYLRKKITHQANDPFSLPFLNLKFEQLESWKGATEQLNLESRIYGMRVDNCHDYTIKMLNYVIRNQEEQIGNPVEKTAPTSSSTSADFTIQHNNHSQSLTNFNSHLEKAEKLLATIELDKNLSNHSLWKVIFKKSETLEKIQLNTIELSVNLCLEIDEKNVQWCVNSGVDDEKKVIDSDLLQENGDLIVYEIIRSSFTFASEKLSIFKEINTIKNDTNKEIDEILQYNQNRQKHRTIEEPLYFGYTELDFDGMYQEFNEFTKFQEHAHSVKGSQREEFELLLDDHNREEVFAPVLERELFEIPIDHMNMMNTQILGFEHEEQTDDDDASEQQDDLYEPHKDILFHSTIRKGKKQSKRIIDPRVYEKRRRNHKMLVDFENPCLNINRKVVFRERKEIKNNIQNDNLVPINYVVLYEHRNPFKKHKKIARASNNRVSFYENLQGNSFIDCDPDYVVRSRESLNKISVSQTEEEPFFSDCIEINHHFNMLEDENPERERYYKNVSMKTVKNEIQKEMSNVDEFSMNVSNRKARTSNYSNFSNFSDISVMDSNLENEGARIGLKFLKQKMVNYDPLDILMSMLHVAYENQVLLQPIYVPFQDDNADNDENIKLQDIIIQGSNNC